MAESEGIKDTVSQTTIKATVAVIMAIRDADLGP